MTDLVKLGGWWLTAHGLLMVDVLWLAWFWVLLWLRMAVKYDMFLFSKKKGGSWGLETCLVTARRFVTGARIYTSASHPFLGWDPSLFKKHQWSQKRLRCSVMRRCESQECDSTQLGGGFKFFSFSPQHQSWFIEKSLHQMMQRSCDWRNWGFSKSRVSEFPKTYH